MAARGIKDGPDTPVFIDGIGSGVAIPVNTTPPIPPPLSLTPEFDIITTANSPWVKSAGVRSFTMVVLAASAGNDVVITTASGAAPPIESAGFAMSWGVDGEYTRMNGGVFSFAVTGTAQVAIGWTE